MKFLDRAKRLLSRIDGPKSEFWANAMEDGCNELSKLWELEFSKSHPPILEFERECHGGSEFFCLCWQDPDSKGHCEFTVEDEQIARTRTADAIRSFISFAESASQELSGDIPNKTTVATLAIDAIGNVIETHPKFDKRKQRGLDLKKAGKSWKEIGETDGVPSRSTIERYAKATGQEW